MGGRRLKVVRRGGALTLGLGALVVGPLLFVGVMSWPWMEGHRERMFVDVATPAMADPGAHSRGACWADIDGDGHQDLFVANNDGPSRLWRNRGDGTFEDIGQMLNSVTPLRYATACAFVDLDHDGYPELFVTVNAKDPVGNRLYRNEGGGSLVDVSADAGVRMENRGGSSSDWAGLGGDGAYTGFVAARTGHPPRHNALFAGQGPFVFRDVAPEAGVADTPGPQNAFIGSWFDYDGDGDPDLLVAIDFWGVELFRNDGGTFTRVTAEALPPATDTTPGAPPNNPMGVTWGDYDNDGCLDVFITGSNFHGQGGFGAESLGDLASRLYRSRCDGTFEDVTEAVGLRPTGLVEWSATFVDYDNDGDLDLSVVAGNAGKETSVFLLKRLAAPVVRALVSVPRRFIPARTAARLYRVEAMVPAAGILGRAAAMPNYLYRNLLVETGRARFVDVTHRVGVGDMGSTQGSAWADYDNDGDLDWFVPNRGGANRLFRNEGPTGHYLRVHLVGSVLRDAIGAQVKIRTGERWQIRHVHVLTGHLSQSQMDPHFGLGGAQVVDEVLVRWPGGTRWVRACVSVPADRTVTITQPQGCRW